MHCRFLSSCRLKSSFYAAEGPLQSDPTSTMSAGPVDETPDSTPGAVEGTEPNYTVQEGRKKGSKLYVHEGYFYNINNVNNARTKINLKCRHSRSDWCPATAVLDIATNTVVRSSAQEHHCRSTVDDVKTHAFRQALFNECKKSNESPEAIYNRLCTSFDTDTVSKVPLTNLRASMSRIQRRDNFKAPETTEDAVRAFEKGLDPKYCGHLCVVSENMSLFCRHGINCLNLFNLLMS